MKVSYFVASSVPPHVYEVVHVGSAADFVRVVTKNKRIPVVPQDLLYSSKYSYR